MNDHRHRTPTNDSQPTPAGPPPRPPDADAHRTVVGGHSVDAVSQALARLCNELGFARDAAQELLREYLRDTLSALDQAQRHIDAKEGGLAARAAHSIRGAAANLQLLDVVTPLCDLEDCCRAANLDEANAHLALARVRLESIQQALAES